MIQFDVDTSGVVTEDGLVVRFPERWIGLEGAMHGGYVLAVVMQALVNAVQSSDLKALTLDVSFLSPARPGEAVIVPRLIRAGRTITTLKLDISQGSRSIVSAIGNFASDRSEQLSFSELLCPAPAPPLQIAAAEPNSMGLAPWARNYEMRPCLGGKAFQSAPRASTGGWIRLIEPRPLDAILVAALVDSWVPSIRVRLAESLGPESTINIGIHFSNLPSRAVPDKSPFGFVMCESLFASAGFWHEDTTVWSEEGRVLARSRQVAIGA